MVAPIHVTPIVYELGYSTRGAVSLFDWDDGNGQEGWPPMDSSQGIKTAAIDTDGLFDEDDMTVKAA